MPISVVVPQRCLTEYKTTPGGVIRRVTFFRCKYQHDFFLEMLGRGGGEAERVDPVDQSCHKRFDLFYKYGYEQKYPKT